MSRSMIFHAFVALYCFSLCVLADYSFDATAYDPQDVITTDVAVVGGGSAGVYSAVRLQDYNKSIVIIEKNDYLGGHAETYIDPQSHAPINLGVVVFPQTQITEDYFARFNVPLVLLGESSTPVQVTYFDYSTGTSVDFDPPAGEDVATAFQGYSVQLQKYPDIQAGFNLTYPVASDLLLPFGEFLNKYNLSAILPTVFIYNQGYAPILNISTLYMLKNLNANELAGFEKGFLTVASHSTGDLYTNILAHLGSSVLLNTTILAMNRSSPSAVKIVVRTTNNHRPKLIIAKRLLSTPPPQPAQLTNYDLSPNETSLFSQFFANGYYVAVLNNTGLPLSKSYTSANPLNPPYDTPHLPGIYSVSPTGASDLIEVFYGSPHPIPIPDVQADILTKVKKLAISQNVTASPAPNIVAFTTHAPFNLMVSNEAIASGFYDKLYALNGQRNTWYNGAAWQTQDSNEIWEFTEGYVLPKLLASLSK